MTVQPYQPEINLNAYDTAAKKRWLFRMLFLLAVLAVFVLVLLKYHGRFGNILSGASNEVRVSTSGTTAEKAGRARPALSRRNRAKHHADAVVPAVPAAQLTLAPGMTEFTIRSPLMVEMISSDGQHQIIRTRDDSIYLYLHDETLTAPDLVEANVGYGTGVIKASERTRLSSGAVELASPPAGFVDSLLAKEKTTEGSVVLLARIDKDGNIQDLQIISGPETLFASAREAVKQWRFKPYYDSGQTVDTEAHITVKFAVSAR
jgi:TonB family protein